MKKECKFRGCLLGGAVGDALGYQMKRLDERGISERYGEISDDTQLMLFTANGLILANTPPMRHYFKDRFACATYNCYLDWHYTQENAAPGSDYAPSSWLANVPGMYRRRDPEKTCMDALSSVEYGTIRQKKNQSKGYACLARVAPVGLFFDTGHDRVEDVDRIGAEIAALTHGHELAYMSAAMITHMIQRLVHFDESSILHAAFDAERALKRLYPRSKYLQTLFDAIAQAIGLTMEEGDDRKAIRQLGKGWVAEEALVIALYCCVRHGGDFESAVSAAANHDGNSDTTAAIAGCLMGAALGEDAIPSRFLDKLELRNVIEDMADDLYLTHGDRNCALAGDPRWHDRYMEVRYAA